MVLTTRNIAPVSVPPSTYAQPGELVLEHVAGAKLVGLLKQVAQLSEFAGDIFAGLLREATNTSARVGALSSRVAEVEKAVPVVKGIFARSKPSHFYCGGVRGGQLLNRSDPGHTALFTPDNMPVAIAHMRAQAQPPPNLAVLDSFAGKSCLAQYSDPSFFFGQVRRHTCARVCGFGSVVDQATRFCRTYADSFPFLSFVFFDGLLCSG
jgi:hypothetical protein